MQTVLDELSPSAKAAIETMQTALASEVTNCLGILINAATAKMVEAINAADFPAMDETEDLEELVRRSIGRA